MQKSKGLLASPVLLPIYLISIAALLPFIFLKLFGSALWCVTLGIQSRITEKKDVIFEDLAEV